MLGRNERSQGLGATTAGGKQSVECSCADCPKRVGTFSCHDSSDRRSETRCRVSVCGGGILAGLRIRGADDNISGVPSMSFRTRGDGKTYTISLFDDKGSATTKYFIAGKDWSEVTFPFIRLWLRWQPGCQSSNREFDARPLSPRACRCTSRSAWVARGPGRR